MAYPFVPKSTAHLERGQFWSIPLATGDFGAGCVVGRCMNHGSPSARLFIAGVVNWRGPSQPTADQLNGRRVVAHAFAHVRAIFEGDRQVLGAAALDLATVPDQAESLALPTWGFGVPALLAAKIAK